MASASATHATRAPKRTRLLAGAIAATTHLSPTTPLVRSIVVLPEP
jgi:hypothetical protein